MAAVSSHDRLTDLAFADLALGPRITVGVVGVVSHGKTVKDTRWAGNRQTDRQLIVSRNEKSKEKTNGRGRAMFLSSPGGGSTQRV